SGRCKKSEGNTVTWQGMRLNFVADLAFHERSRVGVRLLQRQKSPAAQGFDLSGSRLVQLRTSSDQRRALFVVCVLLEVVDEEFGQIVGFRFPCRFAVISI